MMIENNPFVYGRVLRPGEPACVRRDLDRRLTAAIKHRGRIALSGDRRQGKSSLVPKAVAAVKGVSLLTIDLLGVRNTDSLCAAIAIQFDQFLRDRSLVARKLTPWLREIGLDIRELRAQLSGPGIGISISSSQEHAGFLKLLDRMGQIGKRTKLAVLFDEFQTIPDYFEKGEGQAVLGMLRSAVQRQPEVTYFFAGSTSHSFNAMFQMEGAPFFQSAQLIEVDRIPPADFSEFLGVQFAKTGKRADPDALSLLVALGGPRANDVQQLAHEAWYAAESSTSRREVLKGLSKILRGCEEMALYTLGNSTQRQQRALFCVAFFEGRPESLASIARRGGFSSAADYKGTLKIFLGGEAPMLEALPGGAVRFRHHYLRMWFLANRNQAGNTLPFLRDDAAYLEFITPVLGAVPLPILEG